MTSTDGGCKRISVIIPTLNEARYVEGAIVSARDQGFEDVVVCDGGSSDGTIEIAEKLCRTVSADRGRAMQMNAGAAYASGDVLLFLHADTRLPSGASSAVLHALNDADCLGGCFRLRFDTPSPLLRAYSAFTRLPWKSICFGDRAQFFRKSTFETVGGFPDIPIFEDLEIVKLVSRHGRFSFLKESVTTSARRFVSNGPGRQQWSNAQLWIKYRLGVPPDHLAAEYTY